MRITKLLLSIQFLLVIGCVACSASSSKSSVDSIDSTSSDGIEAEAESQFIGMLKAFGLKGKVKTLTLYSDDEDIDNFTFYFDLKGNLIDYPDYNGGIVTKESSSPFFSYEIVFDDLKWTKLYLAGRMRAETIYEMIKYDENNRPVLANVVIDDQLVNRNVALTYSGSDAKENYTKIIFDTKGINYEGAFPFLIGTMNVRIEYWPDNASVADVPTKLSENEASVLIKKANIKEHSALSVDLKYIVDNDRGKNTLINYGECAYVPDMIVKVSDINISSSGDHATVEFYFVPIGDDGKYDESDLSDDEYLRIADFTYENRGWKVDDISWDVHMMYGVNFAEQSYKQYMRNAR